MRTDDHPLIAILLLGACGRLGFDPSAASDGGVDAVIADGTTDAAAHPFVYVQGNARTEPMVTGIEVSLPNQGVGNLNVLVVGIAEPLANIASVSDSVGNDYELAIGPTSSGTVSQWMYTARITATTSTNVVRVMFDQAAMQPGIFLAEYAGVSTTMAVHTASGLLGSSSRSESGLLNVTIAPALIVAANTNTSSGTAGPGAGYTQRLTHMFEDILEDRVIDTPGTYIADAALTTVHGWVMQAIVLSPEP